MELLISCLFSHSFVHIENRVRWMPLLTSDPAEDDLLPTTNIKWEKEAFTSVTTIERHPAGTSPSIRLGTFQRLSQCAILYTKALRWERKTYEPGQQPSVDSFSELEVATRALIEAMVWQAGTWGEYYECFAACTWLVSPSNSPREKWTTRRLTVGVKPAAPTLWPLS